MSGVSSTGQSWPHGAFIQKAKMKFRLQFFKLKKNRNLIGGVTSTVSEFFKIKKANTHEDRKLSRKVD